VYATVMILTFSFGTWRLVFQRASSKTIRVASVSAEPTEQKRSEGLETRMFSYQLTEDDKAVLKSIADIQNNDLF